MQPSFAAPSFDRTGESFQSCARESSYLPGGTERAPFLVLQMEAAVRDYCVAIGAEKLRVRKWAGTLLAVLKNYFIPDDLDAAYQDAA